MSPHPREDPDAADAHRRADGYHSLRGCSRTSDAVRIEGLSWGGKWGIAFGVICALFILAVLLIFFNRRRKKRAL